MSPLHTFRSLVGCLYLCCLVPVNAKAQATDGTPGKELSPSHGQHAVWYVASSDGGSLLASRARGRRIYAWEVGTGKELHQFGQGISGRTIAVSPDGKTLAAGGILWDLPTGREVRRYHKPSGVASYVAFSPDGKILAGGAWSETPRIWDKATGNERLRCAWHASRNASCPSFSPDGKLLAAGTEDGTVHVWETATGREVGVLHAYLNESLVAVTFSADGKTLAGAAFHMVEKGMPSRGRASETRLCLWEVATGKMIRQLESHQWAIDAIAFSPDGKTLAAAGSDNASCLCLWEVATGQEVRRFEGRKRTFAITFELYSSPLFLDQRDTLLSVWDVASLLREGHSQLVAYSAKELDQFWRDLAGSDATRAHRTIWALTRAPQQTLPLSAMRLQPAEPVDKQRIQQLIADLDRVDFALRQYATAELEQLGELPESAMRQALADHTSLEVRRRLEQILEKLTEPVTRPETIRGLRAIEVLEHMGTPEAKQVLARLAQGATEAWLTQKAIASLERLSKWPAGIRESR